MAKICLNMIVKNEASIIEKALAATADIIDYYIICDTGSTDGTPEIITAFFDTLGIPGEIHHINFVNFAHARNKALQLAQRSLVDFQYILLTDADMELHILDPDFKEGLELDSYSVIQKNDWLAYDNIRLVKKECNSYYVGVTHEYLYIHGVQSRLEDIYFYDHCNGANRIDKYQRDVELLTQGLIDEPENARYQFYLAQTYFDLQDYQPASEAYQERIQMGGWEEEVYYAMYRYGLTKVYLEHPESEILQAFLDCYSYRPVRAEPLYELAVYYRQRQKWHKAYLFAQAASKVSFPKSEFLFVARNMYAYQIADELAVCAYWVDKHQECFQLCLDLLASPDLPPSESPRIRKNLEAAGHKLGLLAPAV